ncbi:flavin reductase family protein [Candidatus Bathyarchaeota archaeon]|nr:flavin reductase family protein [Candidatus Bathyarchaeota archaeon]
MLREVPVEEAWKRKYPERTVLAVSISKDGKPNIITLGWNMPTSIKPPMVAISVGLTRYSHKLISESGEFVLAFPSEGMEDALLFCGTHSGRDVDKFRATGLTPVKAKYVKPPLIAEATVNMECRVVGSIRTGDHTIFVGEILAAYVSDEDKPVLFNVGNWVFKGFKCW